MFDERRSGLMEARKENELFWLSEAYSKAERILKAVRVSSESFVNVREPEVLVGDREAVLDAYNAIVGKEVLQPESKFGIDSSLKYAAVLEAIFVDPAYIEASFGGALKMRKTGHFDDVKRGVDAWMFFPGAVKSDMQYPVLAVDFTYATDVSAKLRRNKEILMGEKTGNIKYFNEPHKVEGGPVLGEALGIPRVVAGVDIDHLKELMKLWVHDDYNAMSEHSAKTVLLLELSLQLKTYSAFIWERRSELSDDQQALANYFARIRKYVDSLTTKSMKDINAAFRTDSLLLRLATSLKGFNKL